MDIDDLYRLNPNNDVECYARGKKRVKIIAGILVGVYAIYFLADMNVFTFITLVGAAVFAYFMFKGSSWVRKLYIGSNLGYGIINIIQTIASSSEIIDASGSIGYVTIAISIIVSAYSVISAGMLAFSYDVGTYFQHNS